MDPTTPPPPEFKLLLYFFINFITIIIFEARTAVATNNTTLRDVRRSQSSRSNAGILDSNPTQDTDVCLRLFCVCVS
jgi:hypothetical protein